MVDFSLNSCGQRGETAAKVLSPQPAAQLSPLPVHHHVLTRASDASWLKHAREGRYLTSRSACGSNRASIHSRGRRTRQGARAAYR
jgi:hypothetical protein